MAFRTNKVPVLQEKSASGSVASFNTALAMPLASCNIAVNAWQEGSGDPSPSNIRPIHGFSEVNATRAGKNLLPFYKDIDFTKNRIRYYTQNGNLYLDGTSQGETSSSDTVFRQNFDFYLNKGTYTMSRQYASMYVYKFVGDTIAQIASNSSPKFTLTERTHCFIGFYVYQTTYDNLMQGGQVNAGSSALPYEPCVTPTIYTKQLGETVYGGNYDARTGVFVATHGYIELDGSENWINVGGSYPQAFQLDTGITNAFQGSLATQKANNITNLYPWASDEVEQYGIRWQLDVQSGRLYVYDNKYSSDLAGFKQHLSNTHLQVVYLLNNPTTIQLPPCSIDTLEGVNNIFADTGDIDLTFKDLDLAKRGNFREVFKLPS